MSTFLLLEVFAKLLSKIVIYKRGTGECSIPTPVIFIFSFNHWYFNKQSIFLCIWLSLHVRLAIMYLYASCDFCKAYDLLLYGVSGLTGGLCHPLDCSPPGSSVHGIPQARILEWVIMLSPPGYLPNTGIKPWVDPALAGRFFTTEPPGKPTEVQAQGSPGWLHRHGVQVIGKGFEPCGQS